MPLTFTTIYNKIDKGHRSKIKLMDLLFKQDTTKCVHPNLANTTVKFCLDYTYFKL